MASGTVQSPRHVTRLCAGRRAFLWLPYGVEPPLLVEVRVTAVRNLLGQLTAHPDLSLRFNERPRTVVFVVAADGPPPGEPEETDGS